MFGAFLFCSILSVCYGAINIANLRNSWIDFDEIFSEKYLKVCNRNSLDLNDCMKDAVRKGLPILCKGVDELEIDALDPFYQKEMKVEYKNNQISTKMILKNIYVEGLNGATVHKARVRADDDRLHIEIDMTAPTINIRTEYEGSGNYNALKLNARGTVNTTMSDLVFTWKLDGVPKKKDNDVYMHITSFYMRPDVGKMYSSMTNDNPESKDLTELGVRFLNENWRILYSEFLPFAQSNWNKTGTQVANNIFSRVPYDQILPLN